MSPPHPVSNRNRPGLTEWGGSEGMDLRISCLTVMGIVAFACTGVMPVAAIEAISIDPKASVIGLSKVAEHHWTELDRLQVSTAPGPDGIIRRIEVRAQDSNGPTHWLVFALSNETDDAIDCRLVISHINEQSRVVTVTPSQGTRPAMERGNMADVIPLSLDPGFTITYVAELSSNSIPEVTLWQADAYRKKNPDYKGTE